MQALEWWTVLHLNKRTCWNIGRCHFNHIFIAICLAPLAWFCRRDHLKVVAKPLLCAFSYMQSSRNVLMQFFPSSFHLVSPIMLMAGGFTSELPLLPASQLDITWGWVLPSLACSFHRLCSCAFEHTWLIRNRFSRKYCCSSTSWFKTLEVTQQKIRSRNTALALWRQGWGSISLAGFIFSVVIGTLKWRSMALRKFLCTVVFSSWKFKWDILPPILGKWLVVCGTGYNKIIPEYFS